MSTNTFDSPLKAALGWAATGVGVFLVANAVFKQLSRLNLNGKVVLITGGSRGFGLVLARQLAARGQQHVDLVIVHKIDRLARNRADDVAITLAIREAGAQLVSVSENVDENFAERQDAGEHDAHVVDGLGVGDLAAFFEDELHHVADVFAGDHDVDVDDRLADFLDRDLERRLLAGEIPCYSMEKRYLHREGGIVLARLSVALVRDQAGNPGPARAFSLSRTARRPLYAPAHRLPTRSLDLGVSLPTRPYPARSCRSTRRPGSLESP